VHVTMRYRQQNACIAPVPQFCFVLFVLQERGRNDKIWRFYSPFPLISFHHRSRAALLLTTLPHSRATRATPPCRLPHPPAPHPPRPAVPVRRFASPPLPPPPTPPSLPPPRPPLLTLSALAEAHCPTAPPPTLLPLPPPRHYPLHLAFLLHHPHRAHASPHRLLRGEEAPPPALRAPPSRRSRVSARPPRAAIIPLAE